MDVFAVHEQGKLHAAVIKILNSWRNNSGMPEYWMMNWQRWSWRRAKLLLLILILHSSSYSSGYGSSSIWYSSCSPSSSTHNPYSSIHKSSSTVASTMSATTILQQSWPPKHSKEIYFPHITISICISSFFLQTFQITNLEMVVISTG